MRALTEPAGQPGIHEEDPHSEIRLQNLTSLVSLFKYKSSLARLAGSSPVQLMQAFKPRDSDAYRPVGHRMARRIEVGLGLPEFTMEQPDGVLKHLPDIVARCQAAGIEASLPADGRAGSSAKPLERVRPHLVLPSPLKPLHVATLDALEAALRRGAISDKECLSLMQAWTPEG
jgi:hypothetical protein